MQQARLNGDGIHAHLGENPGYCEGMRKIWIAGSPFLASMMAGSEFPRLPDSGEIVFGPGFVNCGQQAFKLGIGRYRGGRF
jgi:hypothetical protein